MPIDPAKQRKILVVHGVQTGDDDELHQDDAIRQLFAARLGDLAVDYEAVLYKYENIADAALQKVKDLCKILVADKTASILIPPLVDLVGDVVISLWQADTADTIRRGLEAKITEFYNQGHPCYIVAHSLGTVYTFDVVNRLMKNRAYFDPDDRLSWPVQGMVTMGSPLGLSMFKVTGRNHLTSIGSGDYKFFWRNYYDRNDPVVSGNVFGASLGDRKIAEEYLFESNPQGWKVEDYQVNTGKLHLLAHIAYWNLPVVGEGIRSMVVE